MFSQKASDRDCVLLSLRIVSDFELESDNEDSIRTVFSAERGSICSSTNGRGRESMLPYLNLFDRRRHTLPEVFSPGSKGIYWVGNKEAALSLFWVLWFFFKENV